MAYHSLRRDGDAWTWKFSPAVFARGNSSNEWMTMGRRVRGARSAGNRPRRAKRALRYGFRGISARTESGGDSDRRRARRAPPTDAGRAARLCDGAQKHTCALEIGALNQSGVSIEFLFPGGLFKGEFQLRKAQFSGSVPVYGFGMHHCDTASHTHQRRRRADCAQSDRGKKLQVHTD